MAKLMTKNLYLLGISNATAEVEIREQFSYEKNEINAALKKLSAVVGVSECVLVSTCNRTELYVYLEEDDAAMRGNVDRFLKDHSLTGDAYDSCLYRMDGMDVVEHLFSVVCGLKSLILGENQIFGQIKDSFALACENATTGAVLNRLFHQAFQVGKQVRSETSINEGAVSVGSAAVLLARDLYCSLENLSVLLLGAGKIGRLCAKQLTDSGVGSLYVANRTVARAQDLASELGGNALSFDAMHDMLDTVDIIITSVSSKTPMITKAMLKDSRATVNMRPLTLIDLGVPRNIDENVGELHSVNLYNIDDLKGVTSENMDRRMLEAEKAVVIIGSHIDQFNSWMSHRAAVPVINSLRSACESIRKSEMEKLTHKITPETYKALDMISRRIVKKILHNPMVTVREANCQEHRDRLLDTMNELFLPETG